MAKRDAHTYKQIVEWLWDGRTQIEIGALLAQLENHPEPYAPATVSAIVKKARQHYLYDSVEQLREDHLLELAVSKRVLLKAVTSWQPGARLTIVRDAITSLIAIQKREGELTGLDLTPAPSSQMVDMSDEELAAIVNDWQKADKATGSTPDATARR